MFPSEFCEISKNTSGRLLLKAVNYFRKKISIIYVWKGSKGTSAAVSIWCIVIKKNVKIKHINANKFKDFSGNTLTWKISLVLIPYNSQKSQFQNTSTYQKPLLTKHFCNIFPTKTHCLHRPYFFDLYFFSLSNENYFCFHEKNWCWSFLS